MTAGVLLAGACSSESDSSDDDDDAGESTETASVTEGERTEGAPEVPEECSDPDQAEDEEEAAEEGSDATAEVEERGAPEASVADEVTGDEPVDIVEGDGDEVVEGGAVMAHYTIINPETGEILESSWQAGEAIEIPLDQVFPTFSTSVSGMKVAGRRAFPVAATDIAGDPPPPESGLSADDALVFVVDLVSVSAEATDGGAAADDEALAAAEDRGAPDMEVPEGDAGTEELIVIDNVEGDGEVVCPGDTVVAHYKGIQASDGEEFDSSWERGAPIDFALEGVIKGWTDGLVGMQVGGRRTLVIPADQAYGDESTEGRPSGVLVFTIDLVGVE